MKSESFPSDGQLRIGVLFVAAVVAVTAAGAVSSSKKEAEHREAEEAEAALAQTEEPAQPPATESDPPPQSGPADETSSGEGGEQIFVSNGCGGCHTLAAQADASGTIGPTSTRRWSTRTLPSSRRRSSIRGPRSKRASPMG